MTYELALALKNAGFPQTKGHKVYLPSEPISISAYEDVPVQYSKEEYLTIPTLSELIEACGEEFLWLQKCDGWWEACSHKLPEVENSQGSTPEEPVARLWLELNKK